MRYSNLLIATLISVVGSTAVAEVLLRGQQHDYRFDATTGRTYEIAFTSNADQCSGSTEGSCCGMYVIDGNQTPNFGTYHYKSVSASSDTPAKVIVQKANSGAISVSIYAYDRCEYEPPQIVATAPSNTISQQGVGRGQLGEERTLETVQLPGQPYALRDESRQAAASNGGRMSQGNAIFSEAAVGYLESIRDILTEPSRDNDNSWFEPIQEELTDAHYHSGIMYDYMNEKMGINSFDNAGAEMLSFVNAYYPPVTTMFCGHAVPPGELFNAFWNGYNIVFTRRFMTNYFSGDYHDISYAAALDVTAHEWAHAISDRAVNLRYERESGALNEAFSDWVGVAVEWYAGETNWTLGEGVKLIRDMKHPRNHRQPDTYEGEDWQPTSRQECATPDVCENDYCGVHINSGVANKMFQLLVEGGTHNGITVTGVGMDTAIQVAYDAIRNYWTSDESFAGARVGMENAAAPYGANVERSVAMAWYAVGVGTSPVTNSSRSSGSQSGGASGGGCSIVPEGESSHSIPMLLVALSLWALRRRITNQ